MQSVGKYLLVLSLFYTVNTSAQGLRIPQPSTLQTIEQDFGLGQISISYSRPNAKGRKVFDGMEPYGRVWRTGANMATKIKLTDTFQVEGHTVVPGEYGFFTIPGAKEWTIILNKNWNQWGAYSYDSSQDILRFNVKSARLDPKLETFTIQFANAQNEQCDMQLLWDNTAVSIHFTTDMDARVMANIDKAMQSDQKPYYFASIYYYNHNKDMKKALSWISDWDKMQPGAYNVKYWKARIELKMGDKKTAIATATEALKQATAEKDVEYIRLSKEVLAEANKM